MKEGKRIEIGMMKIMPIFDTPAWDDIEQKFGSLDAAIEKLKADRGWQRATISAATILCNRALELNGEKPIDEKMAARFITPKKAAGVRNACLIAIATGIHTEHRSEEDDSGPIDLVLREIEKKPEPEA